MLDARIRRIYSASEIEQMRSATRELAQQDRAHVDENGITFRQVSYEEVELRLRTYLMVEIEPDDLTATAAANEKAMWEESDRLEAD